MTFLESFNFPVIVKVLDKIPKFNGRIQLFFPTTDLRVGTFQQLIPDLVPER